MSEDLLRYDNLIENALREVVRQSMLKVVQNGLPGEHHFYISFLTDADGVEIPDHLKQKYDGEMTIVLQHQFFGLTVTDESFSVILSFNNVKERLSIPFDSITTFADPSVNFALQFQLALPPKGEDVGDLGAEGSADSSRKKDETKSGEVISLDKFRKK